MSAKKLFLFAVTTSLGLAGILAPSCFADQQYTDSLSSASGTYGYYINGTYGRGVSFNNLSFPAELITGSGSNAKYLYGVGLNFDINVRQQAYSYDYWVAFRLGQVQGNGTDQYFNDSQPLEATFWFADQSSVVSTDCFTLVLSNTQMSVSCNLRSQKVVTRAFMTYGRTNSFTYNVDTPIAYYNNWSHTGSISIREADVTIIEYSSAQDQESADIGQISDSLDNIHQDEKDTIEQHGQDAQDSADSLNIGFSVGNPFLNWFALFRDDTCVAIPTIRSWLGINETQVCSPWYGTPVRGVATPIFSILSGMILFGFIVRWLKGNDFDGSIELDG